MFGGYKHCGSEDITVLVCQMISQEHVTKGQCNFMARSPSSYHPAKFGGHKHSGTGDIMFLVDHVISQYT